MVARMIFGVIISLAVCGLSFIDWVYLRRYHFRVFLLELSGYAIVVCTAFRPEWLSFLAHKLGIGRGVDLLTYTVLIWLFRESVLGRVRYHRQRLELTSLVRQIAKTDALRVHAESPIAETK